MENIHKYEADVSKVHNHCVMCGKKIINMEFEYEDYFIIFRGMGNKTAQGFMCFNCWEHRPIKPEEDVCQQNM